VIGIGIVFIVSMLVAIGYRCAAKDLGWDVPAVRRILIALVIALSLATTLYAAEIVIIGCHDVTKYGLLWWLLWCAEHSS
jgi:hypothetical protein